MKRYLEKNEGQVLLNTIRKQFGEVTNAFESLLLPFSLISIREGKLVKLQENEKEDLIKDYEDFELKIKMLIKSTSTFITKSLTENSPIIDNGFIKYVNENVTSVLSLYQNVLNKVKQEDIKIFTLIQNAYFAYTMLARLLNTGIYLYNKHNPDHLLPQIEGIPDPQYLEIDMNNIRDFFTNFFQEINNRLK